MTTRITRTRSRVANVVAVRALHKVCNKCARAYTHAYRCVHVASGVRGTANIHTVDIRGECRHVRDIASPSSTTQQRNIEHNSEANMKPTHPCVLIYGRVIYVCNMGRGCAARV
jgi:hypothetical protein